jgi:hypothetical protein
MAGRFHIAFVALVCSAASASAQEPVRDALASLGTQFERNVGQGPADADFLAYGPGYGLLLMRNGAVVRSAGHRDVRVTFAGGTGTTTPVGEAATTGVVNYLVGNDPARWHTNIATFARVRYPAVYPGIDVVYHASKGELEYDVVVGPGADPRQIRMHVDGADRVALEGGDLIIRADDTVLTVRRPVLYQGEGAGRRAVDGAFVRRADGDIGFDVGRYDASGPLVIDPVLVYSSYLPASVFPSNPQQVPTGIAVGADGAVYLMGKTTVTFGFIPQDDLFIAKVNPSGSSLAFTTYLGGASNEVPKAIKLGPSGSIYMAGETLSFDFPAVATTPTGSAVQGDAFLARLSATGDTLE